MFSLTVVCFFYLVYITAFRLSDFHSTIKCYYHDIYRDFKNEIMLLVGCIFDFVYCVLNFFYGK